MTMSTMDTHGEDNVISKLFAKWKPRTPMNVNSRATSQINALNNSDEQY